MAAALSLAVATAVLVLSCVPLCKITKGGVEPPKWLAASGALCAHLGILNSYGLFARMTTYRHECVIQGSRDGSDWREYSFRYKPGDVGMAPAWAFMHMPR